MKHLLSFLLTLAPLASALAQGSSGVGGGGHDLICTVNGVTQHHLLDLYEGKENEVPAIGDDSASLRDKLAMATAYYAELDPERAKRHAAEVLELIEDVEALEQNKEAPHHLIAWSKDRNGKDLPLNLIVDSDEAYDYPNCKKHQLVRQDFSLESAAPYQIYRPDFESMDKTNKFATLYHEILHKEFRSHGTFISTDARLLNRRIMSNTLKQFNQKSYLEFLANDHLRDYYVGGIFNIAGENEQDYRDLKSKLIYNDAGDIVEIQRSLKISLGTAELYLSHLQFKDRIFQGALIENRELMIQNGFISTSGNSGEVFTLSTAAENIPLIEAVGSNYRITNVIPNSNLKEGNLVILVDPSGKLISRTPMYFERNLDSQSFNKIGDILKCIKRSKKEALTEKNMKAYLENIRRAVADNNAALLDQVKAACSQQASMPAPTASAETEFVLKNLRDPIGHPTRCSGFQVHAFAGMWIGFSENVSVLTCTLTNGSRYVYTGPGFGMAAGLNYGAAIYAGKVILYPGDNTPDRFGLVASTIARPAVIPIVSFLGAKKGSVLNIDVDDLNEIKHESGEDTFESKQVAIGAGPVNANLSEMNWMIRLFKKSDSYDVLIPQLLHHNVK